ncbi:MAG: carboxypeptidase-like regulatory domain-containing protein [Saprospiraceae bacterium]
MRKFLLFTTLLFSISLMSQTSLDSIIVSGMVVDESGQSLIGANVSLSPFEGTISDETGNYSLKIPRRPFALTASYIGYESLTQKIYFEDLQKLKGNQLKLHFTLSTSSTDLPTAEVTAQKIQTLYENTRQIIRDFDLVENLLLVLLQERKTSFLSLQTEDGEVLDTLILPFKGLKLHKGCTGAYHVAGDFKALELNIENQKIRAIKTYFAEDFEASVLPCQFSSPDYIIYKQHLERNNRSIYFAIDRYLGDRTILKEVFDQSKTDAARQYYREIINDYYLAVGSDRYFNIIEDGRWNGDLMDLAVTNDLMVKIWYYERIVLNPVSSFSFQQNGNTLVFDHTNDSLYFFSPSMLPLSKIAIEYPKEENFKDDLYQDQTTQKIFSKCDRKGQLSFHEINVKTGTTKSIYSLENRFYFPTEIKLKDGAAYFIAQTSPSNPYRQIYKQYLVKAETPDFGKTVLGSN